MESIAQQFSQDGEKQNFGEVQYFFQAILDDPDTTVTLALISLHSPPDNDILVESHGTVWAAKYQGRNNLIVIDAKAILSVVAMVPLPFPRGDIELDNEQPDADSEDGDYFFVAEKPGLEIFTMGGYEEMSEADDEE